LIKDVIEAKYKSVPLNEQARPSQIGFFANAQSHEMEDLGNNNDQTNTI